MHATHEEFATGKEFHNTSHRHVSGVSLLPFKVSSGGSAGVIVSSGGFLAASCFLFFLRDQTDSLSLAPPQCGSQPSDHCGARG
ncbi:unnamed protein product [Lota lota]